MVKIITLVGRYGARHWDFVTTMKMTGESAYLTDDTLTGEADHEGRAVVAFKR